MTMWREIENGWLIDFNGMSAYQQLFYTLKLGNRVYWTFIFTFFASTFPKKIFSLYPRSNQIRIIINSSVSNGTLTGTTTLSQREHESNGNKGVLHTTSTIKYSLVINGALTGTTNLNRSWQAGRRTEKDIATLSFILWSLIWCSRLVCFVYMGTNAGRYLFYLFLVGILFIWVRR